MIATTHGAGPFQPAISFGGRLWLSPVLYENEDDAAVAAHKALERALARAVESLGIDMYSPTDIKR